MYSVVIILLLVSSNVESVRNCTYVSCIADFFQSFFLIEDTVLSHNTQGDVKEIKVGELAHIFSDLTDLIDGKKHEKSNGVLKNYGKTQVFVKYVTFNEETKGIEDNELFETTTVSNAENKTINEFKANSSEVSTARDIPLESTTTAVTDKESTLDVTYTTVTLKTVDVDFQIINEQKNKTKAILELIKLNSDNFEKSLGDLRSNEIYEDIDVIYVDDYNSTDYPIIDYIDIYKDTTNEENLYVPTEAAVPKNDIIQPEDVINFVEVKDFENDTVTLKEESSNDEGLAAIVPWIATIFVKKDQKNNQFDYFCDGALLSKKTILTAARCVSTTNATMKPDDLFVVLGKKGLSGMEPNEKAYRIAKVMPHENFTSEEFIENDLAVLILEEPVEFSEDVKPANVSLEMDFDVEFNKSATTAWAYTGNLAFVFFESVQNKTCPKDDYVENTICATYGNKVPLCPSYGGVYVAKLEDQWLLQGIMYGDPTDKGLCFSKNVTYTSLKNYLEWINEILNKYM